MLENPYRVSTRLIKSGNFFELYEYEKPIWIGYPRFVPTKRFNNIKIVVSQDKMRADNVKRTRKAIRRLVNSNENLMRFVTLTFAEDVKDFKTAMKHWGLFIKRIEYRFKIDFKFVCVPEFQDKNGRGVLHFHCLTNLPYIKKDLLERVWGQGFVKINLVDRVGNLGAYMSKYLGKANFDKRFFKQKKFVRSKNLKLPIVLENDEALNDIAFFASKDLHLNYEAEFDTKWVGSIKYREFVFYPNKVDLFTLVI